MDWHEGFQIYGEHGSVAREDLQPLVLQVERGRDLPREPTAAGAGRSARTATSTAARSRASPTRSSTARRCAAPTLDDGMASVRAMVAIARSVASGRPVRLADASGGGLMQLGIFAKTFPAPMRRRGARGRGDGGFRRRRSTTWPASGCLRCPTRSPRRRADGDRAPRRAATGVAHRRGFRHLQHDPPRPGGARRRTAPARACWPPPRRRWALGSSRSAPARAIPTTSGAGTPKTPRPRPGATCVDEMETARRRRRARTTSISASSRNWPTSSHPPRGAATARRDRRARG